MAIGGLVLAVTTAVVTVATVYLRVFVRSEIRTMLEEARKEWKADLEVFMRADLASAEFRHIHDAIERMDDRVRAIEKKLDGNNNRGS